MFSVFSFHFDFHEKYKGLCVDMFSAPKELELI